MNLETGIPNLFWMTYFGKPYVQFLGEKAFEKLPVETKWDYHGGVWLKLSQQPFTKRDAFVAQSAVITKSLLGADAFFDLDGVKSAVAQAQPLGDNIQPESLQSQRKIPPFPFLTLKKRKSDENTTKHT